MCIYELRFGHGNGVVMVVTGNALMRISRGGEDRISTKDQNKSTLQTMEKYLDLSSYSNFYTNRFNHLLSDFVSLFDKSLTIEAQEIRSDQRL